MYPLAAEFELKLGHGGHIIWPVCMAQVTMPTTVLDDLATGCVTYLIFKDQGRDLKEGGCSEVECGRARPRWPPFMTSFTANPYGSNQLICNLDQAQSRRASSSYSTAKLSIVREGCVRGPAGCRAAPAELAPCRRTRSVEPRRSSEQPPIHVQCAAQHASTHATNRRAVQT